MNMKNLILCLSLLIPLLLQGQDEIIVIEWNTNDDQFFFPHALYEDGANTLPYFTRKIAWDAPGTVPAVTIEVEKSSLTGSYGMDSLPLAHLKQEPLLEYSLQREAGRSFVVIKILPFIKNSSGKIEKVESFSLRLEKKMALAPLRNESTGEWAGHSLLATGNWYKIAIEKSGMHKLTYKQLQDIGLENPASVRVYGTGARQLPEKFSEGYVDDLTLLPVYMDKGSDGMFSPGDHILFYAEGPVAWEYNQEEDMYIHELHSFSWKGFYFITDGQGPAVSPGNASPGSGDPASEVSRYDFRIHFEEELFNLISSGKEWYGDNFNVNLHYNYPFRLPDELSGEAVKIRTVVAGRSGSDSNFLVSANNEYLGSISIRQTDLGYYTSTFAYQNNAVFNYTPTGGGVT